MVGLTTHHVRRVAIGRPAALPAQLRIDPRDFIADLKEVLYDDDAVAAWNDDPHCLCGCGEATLQEGGNNGKVPYGAFRLFRGSHEKRMSWVRYRQLILNADPDRRRRNSRTQRAANVSTVIIGSLITDWRNAVEGRTYMQVSEESGVAEAHVRDIVHMIRPRIQKSTAARLLAVIGEPMRPEMAQEYLAWAMANRLVVD